MNYTDFNEAVRDAKNTLDKADEAVRQTGNLMVGRLRKINPYILAKLKKELQQFNAKTQTWNN